MNPRMLTSLGISAVAALVALFTIVRIRRKNDNLLRLRRSLIIHEQKLRSLLAEALRSQSNRRETWARPIYAEISRLDFNMWRIVVIGEQKEMVLTQAWHILEWLCIRETPLFRAFVEASERSGGETHRRVLTLRNTKGLTLEQADWLKNQLNMEIVKKYGPIIESMKEYRALQKRNDACAELSF